MSKISTIIGMYVGPIPHLQRRKRLSVLLHGADSFPIQHKNDYKMINVEFHICETLHGLNATNATKVRRECTTGHYRAFMMYLIPTSEKLNTSNSRSQSRSGSCSCSSCDSSDSDSVLYNILWNFSHFSDQSRLALAQNPDFYIDLSKPNDGFNSLFTDPLAHGMLGSSSDIKIYVLGNGSGRVFFKGEFSKSGKPRVFDKVWTTNNILVFKG